MIELEDVDAAQIASALRRTRREAGVTAVGVVMTLIVVVSDDQAEDALAAARKATREHPARLIGVVLGSRRPASRVDARVGSRNGQASEEALIHLVGDVVNHPASVVLPLLLPDSPVVVWWPGDAPEAPAEDPLGSLATRRITDAAAVGRAKSTAMLRQCEGYSPGNTDLAWTRITNWRALLASALDDETARVTHITVSGPRVSPSADLLAGWLAMKLKAPVERVTTRGDTLREVRLSTRDGDIVLTRADGALATLSSPGQPDRPVALRRRPVAELLTEELRRLDPDDVYAATVRHLAASTSPSKR